ncbi:23S rRNA methyltransferase [Alistipes sp. CAG:831]|nr:23S rRNA methyltransferase [Alistipes sp. CAG:831]
MSQKALEYCADVVQIPLEFSLNVSVAGSIVLYDRLLKSSSFGMGV